MALPNLAIDSEDRLEILGQTPGLNIYTQICICFSVLDETSHTKIVDTITGGLKRLSAYFPWIAGKVVNENSSEGNTGVFKIVPFQDIPRMVVKDLRDDTSAPTLETLRKAEFPMGMIDETVICPRTTLPTSPEEATGLSPVFLLQATFIAGGLLLTFLGQHNTMDMTGQGQIIHLLSKACHGEEFTSEELSSGNLPRRGIVPLLDATYKEGSELSHQIVKPAPLIVNNEDSSTQAASPVLPQASWASFSFPATSLARLKSLANETKNLPSGFVSTDDVLSAFVWQAVSRTRLARLDPAGSSTFARAVDVRRYLDIPATYPGLLQNMTYHTYTLQQLVQEPLGSVASQMRLAVDPKTSDLAFRTRALGTFLDRSPDKGVVSFTATLDLSSDMMFSSWSKIDSYELDFDLGLGKPEAVWRPKFVPVESLAYLLPKARDGEVRLAICLREQDMGRLKADEVFTKYGKFIG